MWRLPVRSKGILRPLKDPAWKSSAITTYRLSYESLPANTFFERLHIYALLLRHDCQRWNGLSCPDNESNIWLKVWCNWGPYFPRYKIGIAEAVCLTMDGGPYGTGVKGCFWSTVGDTLYVLERQRLRTQDSEDRIPFITELDQWPYGPWVKGETVKQLVWYHSGHFAKN